MADAAERLALGGAVPRVVASDLDGTLLRSDGTLSERSSQVWSSLEGRGIQTVVVTARPPRWLHDLTGLVGEHGLAICGNGAFIYEVATRRVVESHCFAERAVESITADLREAVPSVSFAAERAVGPLFEPGFPDPHGELERYRSPRGDAVGLGGEPVGKLLALAPDVPAEVFLATVERVVGDRGHLHYSGAFALAEINPPGVTKAVALERFCQARGVEAREVWAFGDMPNDIPMISWAGVGYAVANAHSDLLAVADRVCGHHDEDGVAVELERLLGSSKASWAASMKGTEGNH